jgi:predicted CXXCH cytochrome family protein
MTNLPLLVLVSFCMFTLTPAHAAKDTECAKCHAALEQKKVVHAPMHDGCAVCHAGYLAESPHRKPASPAVACIKCHDAKLLEGKNTHAPVSAGKCLLCHDPHSSDQAGLLTKEPAALCLDCHAEVTKAPHVVAGFSRSGHPMGVDEKSKKAEDPLRPGRKFYCVSCHEPHRSAFPMLGRFEKGVKASCQACHKI